MADNKNGAALDNPELRLIYFFILVTGYLTVAILLLIF